MSVATYVRVMICGQVPLTTSGLTVTVTGPPQLSVAFTKAVSGGGTPAEAQTVRSGAHCVMTGAVVSLTVMCWLAVATLPQLSVAVHVRVMMLWQLEPGLVCISTNEGVMGPSQLSPAVTSAGLGTSVMHCTVRSSGTPTSTGGTVSFTVMVCTQETLLLHAS